MPDRVGEPSAVAPGEGLTVENPAGGHTTAPQFEQFFLRYAELAPHERGAGACARLADETRGMEVVGPPLAETAGS